MQGSCDAIDVKKRILHRVIMELVKHYSQVLYLIKNSDSSNKLIISRVHSGGYMKGYTGHLEV